MHRSTPAALGLSLLFFAPIALTTACSGGGGRPAERTIGSTERLVGEVEAVGAALGAVTSALEGLRGTVETQGLLKREKVAVADVEKAYGTLEDALDEVREASKDVAKGREALREAVDRQLAKWDADIKTFQSTDLKKSTQQRRDATQARFNALSAELDGFSQRVDGYVARLAEIETALAHDLTPAGVGALDGVLKDAAGASKPVAEEVLKAAQLVRDYAATLSANGSGS